MLSRAEYVAIFGPLSDSDADIPEDEPVAPKKPSPIRDAAGAGPGGDAGVTRASASLRTVAVLTAPYLTPSQRICCALVSKSWHTAFLDVRVWGHTVVTTPQQLRCMLHAPTLSSAVYLRLSGDTVAASDAVLTELSARLVSLNSLVLETTTGYWSATRLPWWTPLTALHDLTITYSPSIHPQAWPGLLGASASTLTSVAVSQWPMPREVISRANARSACLAAPVKSVPSDMLVHALQCHACLPALV